MNIRILHKILNWALKVQIESKKNKNKEILKKSYIHKNKKRRSKSKYNSKTF